MVIGDSVLFKTDDSFEFVYPEDEKYTQDELVALVEGAFFIVHTSNNEKCFVINKDSAHLEYNINANYLFRRTVEDIIVLHGNVLLCNCTLLEDDLISTFLRPTTARSYSEEEAE